MLILRRFVIQCLFVFLVGVLAACGGGGGSTDASMPPPGPTDPAPVDPAPVVPSPPPVAEPSASGCAHPYTLPPRSQCDGVLLTDPASIETRTDGIAETSAANGLSTLKFGAGHTIRLKDQACLQLGKGGNDFSVTFWLKASEGEAQILSSGISQYGGNPGFILFSRPLAGRLVLQLQTTNAANTGGWASVESVPFDTHALIHVTMTYTTRGEGSIGSITVNGVTRSGHVHGDPFNAHVLVGEVPGFGHTVPFEITDLRSYARTLTAAEIRASWLGVASQYGVTAAKLSAGLALLRAHFSGQTLLGAAAFDAAVKDITNNAVHLPASESTIIAALDLLDQYETSAGPLFVGASTAAGIPNAASAGEPAVLREARGMLAVFQAVHDEAFRAESVAACNRILKNRRWATADYFPGKVVATLDAAKTFTVKVNATVPAVWGIPVVFATDPKLRPTGLYLPPGSIGLVTVPAELVNAGFAVQVGAHTADHTDKEIHQRLNRATRRFEIQQAETYVANPLGGGVYIEVPYLAAQGMISVQVQGVVEAPFFSTRSFDATSAAEWQRRRTAGVPWTDFVSDHFMMQVPSNWVYAKADPTRILRDWDTSMQAFSEFVGIPADKRNDVVLYMQPDVQIRFSAFGIGYPQVDNLYDPRGDERGDSQAPMVTDPLTTDADFHELGHAQLFSKFRGEEEALVNLPYAFIANTRFGFDFDEAFRVSFDNTKTRVPLASRVQDGFTPDRAAIDWMVTVNFGKGAEMDYSNTTKDEIRYQARGYAKYADIARLFGWNVLTGFYRQQNLDHMAGTAGDLNNDVDGRILRLSMAAGVDLTPLIHFWGIHPVNPTQLRADIAAKGLPASSAVRDLLTRYRGLIPADTSAFLAFFNTVYPGMPEGDPDFGSGWYQIRKDQWNAGTAQQARNTIDAILTLYFP
jgi:N-terminal domain of M60-like peptidases/Concanavalin A-like lectin/glucanases superfamily/Peptidase M60, enhancin and enhancin-like